MNLSFSQELTNPVVDPGFLRRRQGMSDQWKMSVANIVTKLTKNLVLNSSKINKQFRGQFFRSCYEFVLILFLTCSASLTYIFKQTS